MEDLKWEPYIKGLQKKTEGRSQEDKNVIEKAFYFAAHAHREQKRKSGEYYIKSGSEKKIISTEELKRLFIQSNHHYADEEILVNSSINDLNTELFYQFLGEYKNYKIILEKKRHCQ